MRGGGARDSGPLEESGFEGAEANQGMLLEAGAFLREIASEMRAAAFAAGHGATGQQGSNQVHVTYLEVLTARAFDCGHRNCFECRDELGKSFGGTGDAGVLPGE